MSESLPIAGKALSASLTCSSGGDISINISTDNVEVAGLLCATAVTLGAIYAAYQLYSRRIDGAVNRGLGGSRDDQEIRGIRPGSLHVLLHCFTDKRFLEVVADYETGSMEERLKYEFIQAGIVVEGLKVEIENMKEVYKTMNVIKNRMDANRKIWDVLNEEQRNCLMWPDFILWGDSWDVKVLRQDPNSSLGLVSSVVQDPETKHYYHIIKRIKENHPAHGEVGAFQWIFAVDGKPTNTRNELSDLIRNGRDVVRLSMREAVDPLRSVREWSGEKDVHLEIREQRCGFESAHFYCKDENGTVKDRILIWDTKPGTHPEPSEPLYRGDELLKVNGVAVEGKKLAEICKLIFREIPGMVALTIKKMKRGECQEMPRGDVVQSAPPQPLQEDQLAQRPHTLAAGQTVESSVQEDRVETKDDPSNKRPPERPDTTSNSHEDTEDLIMPQQESDSGGSSGRRRSVGSQKDKKKVQRQSSVSENQGYDGTPESSRKTYSNSSTVKMCSSCIKTGETRLPDDRNKWLINKIDPASYEKICKLLGLELHGNVSLLSAFSDCFNHTEASCITNKYGEPGGKEKAMHVLGKWGSHDFSHNVGALKEIVKDVMKRVDVIEEIEKWEKRHVCHGCGVRLKDKN